MTASQWSEPTAIGLPRRRTSRGRDRAERQTRVGEGSMTGGPGGQVDGREQLLTDAPLHRYRAARRLIDEPLLVLPSSSLALDRFRVGRRRTPAERPHRHRRGSVLRPPANSSPPCRSALASPTRACTAGGVTPTARRPTKSTPSPTTSQILATTATRRKSVEAHFETGQAARKP